MINQQTEHLFGYRGQELLGCPVELLVPPRFRQRHPQQRAEYLLHPEVRPMGTSRELSAVRKDGSEFEAEIRLSPLDTEEGMLIISAIRDISKRKQMEQSLREREIQLLAARGIQQHLLPRTSPDIPDLEIAGGSFPADVVGGDYFDYLKLPDGSTGIVLADVCGHGFPAALLASSTHAFMRTLANYHQELPEILRLVNSMLIDETNEDIFITALLGRLDPTLRSFVYASAGHPSGYLLNGYGDVKEFLTSTGPILAVWQESDFSTRGPYTLESGDMLLLVTDGIIEATTSEGEQFGTEHLLAAARSLQHLAADEIVMGLHEEVCAFVYPAVIHDDVTVVVVKCC